jgi:hypothetical protein
MDTEVEGQVDSQSVDTQESPVDASPQADSSGSSAAPAESGGYSQQQSTPWDAFKRLPEFQGSDDRAIAARLYNAMEREKAASRALAQYQQILPYAQEYLHHRRDFEEFRKSRDQQQAQQSPQVAQAQQVQQARQQPEQSKWWNPPKVRDAYKRYLVKDENGREVVDPEAPLDARHELYEYQQYKADFAKKFLEDPEGALGPMIQDMAAKQAQEIVQKTFEERQSQEFVHSVEEKNSDWLFDSQTGNVTPEGFLVHKYIEEARAQGIAGPQQRWNYAVAMTERELLARAFDESLAPSQGQYGQQIQQAPAPQPAPPAPAPQAAPPAAQPDLAKQNMQYLRREAARNPSRSAGTATNDPRTPKPKRSFEELLREDASSRGLI